ncbi:MAG: glycerophosphodiester phosphodiesterase [Promethearchaeota archaeon]
MWKISKKAVIANNRPLVMAHRGDSANVPENTLSAFEDAYNLNVDFIETDIHITKDQDIIFFHDDCIDRTTEAKGKIKNYTLEELKQFDVGYKFEGDRQNPFPFRGKGYKVLTLEEVLPKFPNVRFNFDIKDKDPRVPAILADKIQKLNVEDRVVVGSFHQNQIFRFRKLSIAATGASKSEVISFFLKSKKWIHKWKKIKFEPSLPSDQNLIEKHQQEVFGRILPYYALQIPEKFAFIKIISPEFIKFAHYVGIAIEVWTINDESSMQRLLDWNADGIFTDNPKLLLKILKERGF